MALQSAPAQKHTNNTEGMIFILCSMMLLAITDALVKGLGGRYSLFEIIFFRSLFAFIPLAYMIRHNGGLISLKTNHSMFHVVRGLLGFLALASFFVALPRMALADAIAITFAAPFFITMLSYPLLKERVGPRRWTAIVIGLIGIALIFRPGTELFVWISLGPLLSALAFAMTMILVRKYGQKESATAIAFYFTVVTLLISALMLPFVWLTPAIDDLLIMAVIGSFAGIANISMTHAFRVAEPSILAPLQYSTIIFGISFGYFFWSEIPDIWMISGATIIISSGIFIIFREAKGRAILTQIDQ